MGILSSLFGTSGASGQPGGLRFDGIYQAEVSPAWGYLRFYEDGTVYSCGTPCEPEEMGKLMTQEWVGRAPLFVGPYSKNGDQISFVVESQYGQIEFAGSIGRNLLELRTHSHINGAKSQRQYKFIPLDL